jgi:hypothetical protein
VHRAALRTKESSSLSPHRTARPDSSRYLIIKTACQGASSSFSPSGYLGTAFMEAPLKTARSGRREDGFASAKPYCCPEEGSARGVTVALGGSWSLGKSLILLMMLLMFTFITSSTEEELGG